MKFLQIALLVVLPFAWGLGVEYLFRYLRGRKHSKSIPQGPQAHD